MSTAQTNLLVASANACLFDLSARLARYSLNETYADAAVELWDWMTAIDLIEEDSWNVNSGAGFAQSTNCSDVGTIHESFPSLLLTQGAAFMYNYVGEPLTEGGHCLTFSHPTLNGLTDGLTD